MSYLDKKFRIILRDDHTTGHKYREYSNSIISIDPWGCIKVLCYGLVVDEIEPRDWKAILNDEEE